MDVQVTEQLAKCIAEQGQAITNLSDVVEGIGSQLKAQVTLSADRGVVKERHVAIDGDVLERVAMLEEQTLTMQKHLVAVVSAVRQIRDHAADALDDRMVAAMGEVHRRIAGSIASVHSRVSKLQAADVSDECDKSMTRSDSTQRHAFVLGSRGL